MMGADPVIGRAKALLACIRRGGLSTLTTREAHRLIESRVQDVAEVNATLEVLEERGYVRRAHEPPRVGRGRPGSPKWDVHPSLYDTTDTTDTMPGVGADSTVEMPPGIIDAPDIAAPDDQPPIEAYSDDAEREAIQWEGCTADELTALGLARIDGH